MTNLIRSAKIEESLRTLERPLRQEADRIDSEDPGSGYSVNGLYRTVDQMPGLEKQEALAAKDAVLLAEGLSTDDMLAADATVSLDAERPVESPPMPSMSELRVLFAAEIEEWKAEATERGFEEGLRAGRMQVEQESASQRERLGRILALVDGMLSTHIEGIAELGAEVVFEAVTRVLGQSYIDRSGVVDVVREVIRQAKDRSRLLIRVSPSDYGDLVAERDRLTEGLSVQQFDICADERIELGGCLLETPSGNLDGRLETQMQQLRDALVNACRRRAESVISP